MNIELKPIAESKIRQLGGDVCGVLVRKDEKLAAVDEHGRVQWLQGDSEHTAYLEGMNAHLKAELKAARAQGVQGAEPVGFIPSSGLNNLAAGHPAKIYPVDATPSPFESHKMLYTQPQPAVPEAKIIIDRVVEELENGFVACERCGDQEDTATLDCMTDLKRVKALLSTPTTPQADGWISMTDRHPTKSDEDCEGQIWLLWPDRRYFERVTRCYVSCYPEFFWMPTGLKLPQLPAELAGGEK